MAAVTAQIMAVPRLVKLRAASSASSANTQTAQPSIKLKSNAKYPRIGAAPAESLELYQVIRYPILTEAAVTLMEKNNTLVFVVDARADKKMIRGALKGVLGVEAKRVNTLVRYDGTKKAYVKLAPGHAASDVATRIGMF